MNAPTLEHLNADSTWMLSIPISSGTATFVIDPWFCGPQIDYHPLFSLQQHTIDSAVASFPELMDRIARPDDGSEKRVVSGVIIVHEFSDHLHRGTIDEVPADMPFYAVPRAAKILRSWGRTNVREIEGKPLSICDGEATLEYVGSTAPLWRDLIGARLHGALVISISAGLRNALIYTPHGLPPGDLERWKDRNADACILALIAGWDQVTNPWYLGGPLNLGLPTTIQLFKSIHPRYWIRTHDEPKFMGGFVGRLIERKTWTREDVQTALNGIEVGEGKFTAVELGVGQALTLR